jgi:hypothetical protein
MTTLRLSKLASLNFGDIAQSLPWMLLPVPSLAAKGTCIRICGLQRCTIIGECFAFSLIRLSCKVSFGWEFRTWRRGLFNSFRGFARSCASLLLVLWTRHVSLSLSEFTYTADMLPRYSISHPTAVRCIDGKPESSCYAIIRCRAIAPY